MKAQRFAWTLVALGVLSLASCSDNKKAAAEVTADNAAESPKIKNLRPGAIAAETIVAEATVESVDPATRTVTLAGEGPNGEPQTFKCGKEVINFDQIHPGDRIRVTATEEVAIAFRKAGDPPRAEAAGVVAVAPKGAKPGLFTAQTAEITAKVVGVDETNHTITLTGVRGKTRTFRVDPYANLTEVHAGDTIVAQYAQSLGILVEKP
jgi:Cu/Ag efflux protein CusF